MKKTKGRKSHNTVPLINPLNQGSGRMFYWKNEGQKLHGTTPLNIILTLIFLENSVVMWSYWYCTVEQGVVYGYDQWWALLIQNLTC
jgi:hypothetical protein